MATTRSGGQHTAPLSGAGDDLIEGPAAFFERAERGRQERKRRTRAADGCLKECHRSSCERVVFDRRRECRGEQLGKAHAHVPCQGHEGDVVFDRMCEVVGQTRKPGRPIRSD
jgi:hypothetical protein